MKSNATGWLAFGLVAVLGVGVASCAISQSSASPRAFISDNYDCDGDPTQRDSVRCETFGDAVDVVSDIRGEVRPIDTGIDDGTHYMQYEDDIVAVSEDGVSGTTVEVDDYDDGARRHGAAFAVFGWSSFRPSGGAGGSGGSGGGWGGGGK